MKWEGRLRRISPQTGRLTVEIWGEDTVGGMYICVWAWLLGYNTGELRALNPVETVCLYFSARRIG